MPTNTHAPLEDRLDALAILFDETAWKENITVQELTTFLRDHAYSLSGFAQQVREEYVRADAEDDVPTNAQGIALARFLRPAFRGDVRDRYANVSRGGAGLSDNYLFVRLADGYEGGIDREGRTST